jgi:hypothetical protein
MLKKKYPPFLCSAALIMYAVLSPSLPAASKIAGEGPLVLQVHVTNPLSNISSTDLGRILSGRAGNFKEIGGKEMRIHIVADRRISARLEKAYPRMKFTVRAFDEERVLSDRGFLGLSDVRGLAPCFKALYIDNTLPWGKILDDCSLEENAAYPVSLDGAEPWDPGLHLSIVQTGVTAMTRAFIPSVEKSGDILSPIRYTKRITSRADLAMTSNEVSFLEPCTYPLKNSLIFCSPTGYFKILKESGFDLIELTGNHNNDFGSRHNTRTIEMIEAAGMSYFGGGKNKSDAERVRYVSVKGTVIAFIGFNECGPDIAWATGTGAGAARFYGETFSRAIAEGVKKADAVFVTVQWCNEDNPNPQAIQKRYFRRAAELGATIIVSSSAHRPMGLEFYRGRFISYGLGNFLFDQMQSLNHRRGLIARHHLYRGKHVTTELIPYLIYDYSQPRIISGREARELFNEIFRYSEGPVFK